ncbi:hypothetical protein TNCV_2945641 [Trichonephila clavipes]|nr:hypothetical protein TNCV_2945641 [Trichonephila clavipes]
MWNPQKAGYLLRNILGSKVVKTNLKGLPYQLFCYQREKTGGDGKGEREEEEETEKEREREEKTEKGRERGGDGKREERESGRERGARLVWRKGLSPEIGVESR